MDINVLFSINRYDRDGDINEIGIWLHFGDTSVKVAETLEDLSGFINQLKEMFQEIEENYELKNG